MSSTSFSRTSPSLAHHLALLAAHEAVAVMNVSFGQM